MIYCVLCNSHCYAVCCKNQQKGEAVMIQLPPPHVFLDITCSGYDCVTLKRGCNHPELQDWQMIFMLQHFVQSLKLHHLPLPKKKFKNLYLDTLKLCTNTKCHLCWTCYCSICTKRIFKNVSISRWNPGSSKVKGKTPLGFKRGSISPIPF